MIMPRQITVAILLACTSAGVLEAQALTNLTSLYVGYSTRRNQANPQGELKARLDSIEGAMGVATRAGQTEEVRRLLTKASVVLAGRAWSDSLDFATSLRLRTDAQIIDSRQPYALRVQQLYKPSLTLSRAPVAHVVLRKAPTGPAGTARSAEVVKDFAPAIGATADMISVPIVLPLDLRDVPDGNYVFSVEVTDSSRAFARPALAVVIRNGIDARAKSLEAAAARAPAAFRGELLYAVDRMHHVNSGDLPLAGFDTDLEFARADSVLVAEQAGKDPFAGKTGDIKKHFVLEGANEVMPYRLYVPASYRASTPMPLIVALHGLGGTEDSFFAAYGQALPRLAETNGYIVVAPLGYRVDGFYGAGGGVGAQDAAGRKKNEMSEADVMQALALVRATYNVDERRIYLVGHSMGAIGTWYLAARYPAMWAGLGVFSGQGAAASAERMKAIPEFVVHGDADPTVNVNGSRSMVAALKAAGADVQYTEIPGGNHTSVVEPQLAAMFQFFSTHRRTSP